MPFIVKDVFCIFHVQSVVKKMCKEIHVFDSLILFIVCLCGFIASVIHSN